MPEQSTPPSPGPSTFPPGVPVPPPPLDRRKLWISLLAPPITMAVGMTIFVTLLATNASVSADIMFQGLCIVFCLVALGGWVLFAQTMSERFIGSSRILLILAYPIVQAILGFSIFFVGCLASIWAE